jgi:hypothetical protein
VKQLAAITILFVFVPLVWFPNSLGVAMGVVIYKLAGILEQLGGE